MSSLRRPHCSPAAPPLDDDDLLAEILLRLPPQPSSLPRACLVSKRWRLLVSDPRFLRRFRIHHRRSPPLLGWFVNTFRGLVFAPAMEAPNRVPRGLFSFQRDGHSLFTSLGCRHGLVLISDARRHQFFVWDPVTGDQHPLAIPPGFDPKTTQVNGAVLRAAGGVHFQVVFVAIDRDGTQRGLQAITCVYSSETGVWGNLVSTPVPFEPQDENDMAWILFGTRVSMVPAVLVGDSLYWQITGFSSRILEFDTDKQSLAVICVPGDVFEDHFKVIRADGGGLGFLFVSNFTAQLWKRKINCDGVASWVLARIIELDKLLSLNSERDDLTILGFAEENNVVFLWTSIGLFEVQLQSLQFKILSNYSWTSQFHPFEGVYTADIRGEHDGAEHLHNA